MLKCGKKLKGSLQFLSEWRCFPIIYIGLPPTFRKWAWRFSFRGMKLCVSLDQDLHSRFDPMGTSNDRDLHISGVELWAKKKENGIRNHHLFTFFTFFAFCKPQPTGQYRTYPAGEDPWAMDTESRSSAWPDLVRFVYFCSEFSEEDLCSVVAGPGLCVGLFFAGRGPYLDCRGMQIF